MRRKKARTRGVLERGNASCVSNTAEDSSSLGQRLVRLQLSELGSVYLGAEPRAIARLLHAEMRRSESRGIEFW
jgi:hypothetical protein